LQRQRHAIAGDFRRQRARIKLLAKRSAISGNTDGVIAAVTSGLEKFCIELATTGLTFEMQVYQLVSEACFHPNRLIVAVGKHTAPWVFGPGLACHGYAGGTAKHRDQDETELTIEVKHVTPPQWLGYQ
jgi:hypothetical protein